ncbi:MAG TPA: hypothetical protein ENK85_10850 [Saprospiraceae bacterium]|nr:hypothetical protein [Saprospiraceae bacterium]
MGKEKIENNPNKELLLGLIGYPLGHSFSRAYFSEKFKREGRIHLRYQNFPLKHIEELPQILHAHPNLLGFNVTIPYKKAIIPYLSELDPLAQKVGAVNTVVRQSNRLKGYNTDVYGFSESLKNVLQNHRISPQGQRAVILGTGGASEAVKVGLDRLNIPYTMVSRTAKKEILSYDQLHKKGLQEYSIIINTTPLGMAPNLDTCPDIPYDQLTPNHLLFDLVYNPAETLFLKKGKTFHSICKNGKEMLDLQAEAAFTIWENSNSKAMGEVITFDNVKSNNQHQPKPEVDFDNTEIAFAYKSDKELKDTDRIFRLMSRPTLVKLGSNLSILALKMHVPFVKSIIKNSIYKQFCGGTTLLNSLPAIQKLAQHNTLTILDYSSEGKDSESELNKTMNEIVRAIGFAKDYDSVPIVSVKVSGLVQDSLLENLLLEENHLIMDDLRDYRNFLKRMDNICYAATKNNVIVYFDAEESWIQDAIDHVVTIMMRRYNKEKAVVFNTYQMYRHDRLAAIMKAHEDAQKDGYILGVKTVRGAYMDRERARAKEKGYPSPIYPDKKGTDNAYDMAVKYCLDNIETIALCNATHNTKSCQLHVDYLRKHDIPINHPHQIISQLFGMSDNITFNLAAAGYRASKYLPYGPVNEVIPYLVRRAEENTSITGDLTRERAYILTEMKRRGL